MNRVLSLLLLIVLSVFHSCSEISTEVADIENFEHDEQLAVVGYLSNYGAVVNLQRTFSPLDTSNRPSAVESASIHLYAAGNDIPVSTFEKLDGLNYCTPENFIPQKSTGYYIKVTAPGFETIQSGLQTVMELPTIDSIRLEIYTYDYTNADTSTYDLFGKPRVIHIKYYINNHDAIITNYTSNFLFGFRSAMYTYSIAGSSGSDKYALYNKPHFYVVMNPGANLQYFSDKQVWGWSYVEDQIATGEKITWQNIQYNVLGRIEKVLVQPIVYSSDFFAFFESVRYFAENKLNPFSMLNENTPSNMSNQIGFFGGVFIAKQEIELPDVSKGSFLYTYP